MRFTPSHIFVGGGEPLYTITASGWHSTSRCTSWSMTYSENLISACNRIAFAFLHFVTQALALGKTACNYRVLSLEW
jgi:hypothetical protein